MTVLVKRITIIVDRVVAMNVINKAKVYFAISVDPARAGERNPRLPPRRSPVLRVRSVRLMPK